MLSSLFNPLMPPLSLAPNWLPDLHLTWHLIFSLPQLSHDLIRQLSTQPCCWLCLTDGVSENTPFPALKGDCSGSPEWKGIALLRWAVFCCGEGGVKGSTFTGKFFSLHCLHHINFHQTKICKSEMWNDSDIFDRAPCRVDKRMYVKGNMLISNCFMCSLEISCCPLKGPSGQQGMLVSQSEDSENPCLPNFIGPLERALVIY